jgi:predicted nucleic acid-binding OB-fold protein
LLVDTKKASKTIQEDMKLSINSREIIEAVLYMEKAKEIFAYAKDMTKEEKAELKDLVGKQIMELEEEFTKFFS